MRTLLVMLLAASTATAQRPAQWRLVEEWRVGGDVDGAHSFADTRGIGLLPDGRIAILDYKDAQVHILSAQGRPIRTVGRKGAGPGEFDRPNGLVVNQKGEIVINDPVGNNRLTILASNGDFIKTVPMLNRVGYGFVWDAFLNSAGLLEEPFNIRKGETSIAARRVWSADYASIDTIAPVVCANTGPQLNPQDFYYRFEGANGSMTMGIPYVAPRGSIVRGRDGSIWTGTYPGYMKVEHRPARSCEADISISLRGGRLRIPANVRDTTIAMVKANAARYRVPDPDFGKIPTEFPGFEALYIDQSRRLWVERLVDVKTHRFEVFSPGGALLADVTSPIVPSVGRPVIITADRILCFVADEDGLMHLVSLRIVPQP